MGEKPMVEPWNPPRIIKPCVPTQLFALLQVSGGDKNHGLRRRAMSGAGTECVSQ